jgi:hypothetical protein
VITLAGKEKKGAKLRIGLYLEDGPRVKKIGSTFLPIALRFPKELRLFSFW